MKKVIVTLKNNINKDLISIYSCKQKKDEEESFAVGVIESLSSDYVVIKAIDQYGCADGWMLISIKNIYKIETDDEYLNKMRSLYKIKNIKLLNLFDNKIDENESLKLRFLKQVKKENYVISIVVKDEEDIIIGRVDSVNNQELKLQVYDYYGKYVKKEKIKLEFIDKVYCNSKDEEAISLLLKFDNKI